MSVLDETWCIARVALKEATIDIYDYCGPLDLIFESDINMEISDRAPIILEDKITPLR